MRYIQNHGNKRRKIAGKFLIFIFIVVLMAAGIFSGCSTKESSLRQESESQQLKQDGRENGTADKETDTRKETETESETVAVPERLSPGKNEVLQVPSKPEGDKKADSASAPDGNKDNQKIVYLTFDDGPCSTTPKLLDVLDKYQVKATFFVTAQFMSEDDLVEQIKNISDRGHRVAVHSYSHDYKQIYSSVDAFMADYNKMDQLIQKATGTPSKIFRFPGGSNTGYNEAIRTDLIRRVKDEGLIYYDWNAYDGDCDGYKGDDLIKRAVKESTYTKRSILLMHNIPGKDTVIESLPEIIRQLKEAGYSFELIDENTDPIQFAKG